MCTANNPDNCRHDCGKFDHCCFGRCARLRGVCIRRPCLSALISVSYPLAFLAFPIGLGFLLSLIADPRAAALAEFNAASSAWSAGGARAFASLNASLLGDGGAAPLALASSTALNAYPDPMASSSQPLASATRQPAPPPRRSARAISPAAPPQRSPPPSTAPPPPQRFYFSA